MIVHFVSGLLGINQIREKLIKSIKRHLGFALKKQRKMNGYESRQTVSLATIKREYVTFWERKMPMRYGEARLTITQLRYYEY